MVSVRALERIKKLSGHAPILETTGTPRPLCKCQFNFELRWLQREGFHDMVKNVWERQVAGNNPILRWNNKMCAMRKDLSGWATHVSGINKKENTSLSYVIDDLEALAEIRPLST
jgi:hypothetical protein